jgi:hypothetical protein
MQNFKDEDLIHFAVVVEGEVATYMAFPKEHEMNIAIYKSNPVFIEVPFNQKPGLGLNWDGEQFSEPGVE